jgi:hypothetical protein
MRPQLEICRTNGKLVRQAKKWLAVTIFNGEQKYLAERGRLR